MTLAILLFFALATPCQGLEAPPKYLSAWSGLDSWHNSAKIDDTSASALSNVTTDRGVLEKRYGSEYFQTLLTGWSVQYLQEFVSPSKTRYIVAHASSTVYYSDTSAAFAFLSTTTAGYNLDCTSAFGKLYCADGFAQPWYWDGTSTTTASDFPICTFLEFDDERIYCANTDSNDSRIETSAFGDATDWTVSTLSPMPADTANQFTFQRTDGEGVTCFKVTPWGKFVGKYHSTHRLLGYDNDTYEKRLLSPNVGCVDDRSVQMVDGVLMWLALEGVYAWNGRGAPELISKDIDDDIKEARQLASNKTNWVNSTQADFQAGALNVSGPGALISAEYVPGSITPSTWTVVDTSSADFNAGTLGGVYASESGDVQMTTWTVARGLWEINSGALSPTSESPSNAKIYTISTQSVGTWSFDVFISTDYNGACNINFMSTGGKVTASGWNNLIVYDFGLVASLVTYPPTTNICSMSIYEGWNTFVVTRDISGNFTLTSGTNTCSGTNTNITESEYLSVIASSSAVKVDNLILSEGFSTYIDTAIYTSKIFNTNLSTPVGGPFIFSDTVPTGSTVAYSVRSSTASDGTYTSWTLVSTTTSGAYRVPLTQQYWQYKAALSTDYSTQTPSVQDVTLIARTTATYYSDVKYIGTALSAWLTFDAGESLDGGSMTYYTRASTYSFTKYASAPSWVAQTNHLQVTASTGATTGTWYQWQGLFNVPSGSCAVTVQDVTTNWQEGSAAPVASMVWDHRYHLCVMNASDTLVNDRCWVYQRNNKWTHFDGPNYSALAIFNNEPIAGSANTDSYIYKIMRPDVYNDNGVAIDAYWETGDWTFDVAMAQKKLNEVWIDAQYLSGGTLDIGYALDKSDTFTSVSTDLDTNSNYVAKRVEGLIGDVDSGRYVRLRFGNSVLDQGFTLNSVLIKADIFPLRSD